MNANLLIEPALSRRRRRHSDAFKAEVIRACGHPGVSIAAVALANGLNANLVRRWVANGERDSSPAVNAVSVEDPVVSTVTAPSFVPLQLPAPARESSPDIQIELCRAGTTIKVRWPASAASECAAWMRELLR